MNQPAVQKRCENLGILRDSSEQRPDSSGHLIIVRPRKLEGRQIPATLGLFQLARTASNRPFLPCAPGVGGGHGAWTHERQVIARRLRNASPGARTRRVGAPWPLTSVAAEKGTTPASLSRSRSMTFRADGASMESVKVQEATRHTRI